MNNSNSRDVQDLIAEFVSSKNQLLHEEIISSIKRESFTNLQDEESSEADISPQAAKVPVQKHNENIEALEKKIEVLTERNLELQQELTMIQMQESQTIASAKPIGTDELRMEFLNFTSAHIQQFNTRIKKTEELIESQIQKNQNPSERNSKKEYPIWLFWSNVAALCLIAIFFLFQIFSGGSKEPASNKDVAEKKPVPVEVVSSAVTPAETNEAQNNTSENKDVSNTTTTENAEPVSTPFHSTNTSPLTANSLEDKNQIVPQSTPVKTTVNTVVAAKPEIKTQAVPTVVKTNTIAKQTAKPSAKVVERTPQTHPVTASIVKASPQQKTGSPVNAKPQTEKKLASKDKVYFGED